MCIWDIPPILKQAIWSDLEITAVEDMNGTASLPIMFGIRTKRIKKGSYGIAGIVTITDLFDGYDVNIHFFKYLIPLFKLFSPY